MPFGRGLPQAIKVILLYLLWRIIQERREEEEEEEGLESPPVRRRLFTDNDDDEAKAGSRGAPVISQGPQADSERNILTLSHVTPSNGVAKGTRPGDGNQRGYISMDLGTDTSNNNKTTVVSAPFGSESRKRKGSRVEVCKKRRREL